MEFCLDYVKILFSGILAKFRDSLYINSVIWMEFRFRGIPCSMDFRGILGNLVTNCDGIPMEFRGIPLDTLSISYILYILWR